MTRKTVAAKSVLGVAVLGSALAFVDATIVNVAFPDIQEDFSGSSFGELSWVLNAYNIVFAALLVPAGRVADLLGRRRLFLIGVWLFTIASVLCAVAPSLETLVAARVLQAVGAAVVVPTSLALVLQAYGDKERAVGVALWSASAALAAGLGPSLGGVLVELGGWRLAFLVNIPLGALTILLARRTLVESRAPGRRRLPDVRGAAVLAAGTAVLTFAIVQAPERGWGDLVVLIAFGVAAALLAVLVQRIRSHPRPILDPELLRTRHVAVASTLTVLAAAGFYAYVLCNVLYLTAIWDYSVLEAGLALTPGPFVAAAVARPAGRLAGRVGARTVIAAGCAVWSIGVLLLITRVGATPAFLAEWLPAMIVLGLGAGLAFPTAGAAAVASVPGGRYAMATSLNSIARQLGAVLGVALLVAIVGTPETPQAALDAFDRGWVFAAGCFVVTALIAPLLGRDPEPAPAPATAASAAPAAGAPAEPELPAVTATTGGIGWPAGAPGGEPLAAPEPATAASINGNVAVQERSGDEVLAAVPLLAGLRPELLAQLSATAETVRLAEGDVLMHEGDPGDALYVILSGRLEVYWAREHTDVVLDVLGPGAVVGEFAVLTGEPRSASVRARRDCSLVRLGANDFQRVQQEDPEFTAALLRNVGKQLSSARIELPVPPPPSEVIALVAGHDGLPLAELRDALAEGLARKGSACVVEEPDDPAHAAERLDRAERSHAHVLLVAGDAGDAWTGFCLRHADRVVLLADASAAPPPPGHPFAALVEGCDLVAVGDAPLGPWMERLSPRSRHLVRPGDTGATLAAAARRLSGTSVGVVLSGGGARGLAHIGVLEELLGAGIAIDRIGGCSFGALVAAGFAAGHDPETTDAILYEEIIRRNPFSDYRLPRVSFIGGERVTALLRRHLPGGIEDLPRDFFCVSTDLVTGEMVVHRDGPVAQAVRASVSIPGWLPPVVAGNRILVDGGVRNNLPVDIMAATGEGPVIAVDVTNRIEFDPSAHSEDQEALPRLGETLLRSLTLASFDAAEAAARQAAVVIRPDSDGAGLFEFHQLDALRAAGRRAAAEALGRLPAGALR